MKIIYVGKNETFFNFLVEILSFWTQEIRKLAFSSIRRRSFASLAEFDLIVIDLTQEWTTYQDVLDYICNLVSNGASILVVGGEEINSVELLELLTLIKVSLKKIKGAVKRNQSGETKSTILKILKKKRAR